jgi:HEAT repeat protein
METPVAILNWFRSRSGPAVRFRLGSLFLLLALGWPMILPGMLALTPGYVEFEFTTLAALLWVWFPSAVMFSVGLLMCLVPGLREWRVPFRFIGIVVAVIVPGGLRVAYEHGLDLTILAGLLGSRAVPALIHVLAAEETSSHVTFRSRVARDDLLFLGRRGVPRLIADLKNSDRSVRTSAAGVLAQLGPEAESAEAALINALKDPDSRVTSAAADAVLRVAPSARFKVPVLIDIVKGGGQVTRNDAAIALGDLGPLAVEAVPVLSGALKDTYWAVRVNAANALGSIGPSAATAVPVLLEALKDPEPRVQSAAAAALGRIKAQ